MGSIAQWTPGYSAPALHYVWLCKNYPARIGGEHKDCVNKLCGGPAPNISIIVNNSFPKIGALTSYLEKLRHCIGDIFRLANCQRL